MSRILGGDQRQELRLHDYLSDSDIVFGYRMPTTAEVVGYENEVIKRRGRKIKFHRASTQLMYGLKILLDIREGDFEVHGKGGKTVPLSCAKDSPNYREDWKKLLEQYAADLVRLLAAYVFEGSAEVEEPDDDEEPAGEDAGK